MLGDAVNGVIGPVFETVWHGIKAQYDEGLKDVELKERRIATQKAIKQAAVNYHDKYLQRHCNIKVLPGLMKEPIPLNDIYTAVQFLDDSELKYFALDNLEKRYREGNKRRFRVGSDERQDGLKVANREPYLMVLGGPGVGKSTFLRKLGLEALQGSLDSDLMPIFIELKSFKSTDMTLVQKISEELKIAGFPGPKILVNSMLEAGKMLILLDGLDEVPSKQVDSVIDQIKDFCDRYSQNRFVTSCRIAAYKGGFNRFFDVTMAEFDDKQVQEFINRWFNSELDKQSDTSQRFWEILQQLDNASAKELAQTPLLLTFLCAIYDRSQTLPTVRSTLYGDALNILLKDWAAEKRLEREQIYQGFHADLEKELLAEIAYESFQADQLFFSQQEVTDKIAAFLADTLDAPEHLDGGKVLKAIEEQQGILVKRATDAYSFSHLTFQEYLVACYLSSTKPPLQQLVSEHLTDERWREVFLLVSGLIGKQSHELLLAMEQQANTFIQGEKLQHLLKWATDMSDGAQYGSTIATRALFLSSALNIATATVIATDVGNDNIFNSDGIFNSVRVRNLANAYDVAGKIARAICSETVREITSILNSTSTSPINSSIASSINSDLNIARAINSALSSASDSDRARIIAKSHNSFTDIIFSSLNDSSFTTDSGFSMAKVIASELPNDSILINTINEARARVSTRVIARAIVSAIVGNIVFDSDNALPRARAIASDRARGIAVAIADTSTSDIMSNVGFNALSAELERLKSQMPSNTDTPREWNDFADQLTQTYIDTFHLDKELVTFTLNEAQNFESYLYSMKLLLDCKASAVRVSRKEWQAIEARLLTVPSNDSA